jgi:hypothetical protein
MLGKIEYVQRQNPETYLTAEILRTKHSFLGYEAYSPRPAGLNAAESKFLRNLMLVGHTHIKLESFTPLAEVVEVNRHLIAVRILEGVAHCEFLPSREKTRQGYQLMNLEAFISAARAAKTRKENKRRKRKVQLTQTRVLELMDQWKRRAIRARTVTERNKAWAVYMKLQAACDGNYTPEQATELQRLGASAGHKKARLAVVSRNYHKLRMSGQCETEEYRNLASSKATLQAQYQAIYAQYLEKKEQYKAANRAKKTGLDNDEHTSGG